MARLDFYQDGRLFVKLALEERPVTLGRSADCDITLSSPKISRVHVTIAPEDDGWLLENHGRNGTRVNSEIVQKVRRLAINDRIYIENYVIIFSEGPSSDELLEERQRTEMSLSAVCPPRNERL